MAAPTPLETRLLAGARGALARATMEADGQLDVLEAVAAGHAGHDLVSLRGDQPRTLDACACAAAAAEVAAAIARTGVPVPLALASMATPQVDAHKRKTTGAYYTDFRLAAHLASAARLNWDGLSPVVDPASGTGMLLAALALGIPAGPARNYAVGELFCAADLDDRALRGARIALAAAVDDLCAASAFGTRARRHDSLAVASDGWADLERPFGLVIANPPWEKLKVTRHELLRALGVERHYGHDVDVEPEGLAEARVRVERYAAQVGGRLSVQGDGEVDLYKLFLALAFELAPAGAVAMYVPAGLIRSSGTERLRKHLLERATDLTVSISDNKASYFAIDTRFKFLAVTARLSDTPADELLLQHLDGDRAGATVASRASLSVDDLSEVRPDLTLPEVRDDAEWRLFMLMSRAGRQPSDERAPWWAPIVREVDMSRDRPRFVREPADGFVPVIEGRMVHQHTNEFKRYIRGTGRSAKWEVGATGDGLGAQFWIAADDLPGDLRERVAVERVGFCDITGQTNERAMLAARIPAGAVCGNKVPTMCFPGEERGIGGRGWLWLAVVNSLPFDWLLRRVVTTTVNYFVLRSVPLPPIEPASAAGQRLVALAQSLDGQAGERLRGMDAAGARAEIDARVAHAYRLTVADLEVVLRDFPLLDRGQPMRGVTADALRGAWHDVAGEARPRELQARIDAAENAGALAYVPAEVAKAVRNPALTRRP